MPIGVLSSYCLNDNYKKKLNEKVYILFKRFINCNIYFM